MTTRKNSNPGSIAGALAIVAVFASVAYAAIGYDSGDGKYKGKDPGAVTLTQNGQSMSGMQALCNAIDRLRAQAGTNAKFKAAADGLADMKIHGRIGIGCGTEETKVGAPAADTDEKLGSNKSYDRINVSKKTLEGDLDVAAAVLLHEYSHVCASASLSADRRKDEICAYWTEYCFLRGISSPSQAVQGRIAWLEGCFSGATGFKAHKDASKTGYPAADVINDITKYSTTTSMSETHYDFAVEGSTIKLYDTQTGASSSIDTGIGLVAVEAWHTTGGQHVMLVCGHSGSSGIVKAYRDVTGNDLPDASSATEVVSASAGLGTVSGLLRIGTGTSAKHYLFDLGAHKVYNLIDSDSDEVPDTLGTVFASPSNFSELSTMKTLAAGGDETNVKVSLMDLPFFQTASGGVRPYGTVTLSDVNADGTADSSTGLLSTLDTEVIPPVILNDVGWTQTSLVVHGIRSHSVRALAFEAGTGDYTESLGLVTLDSSGRGTIALSRGLRNPDTIIVKDLTLNLASEVYQTHHPRPLLYEISVEEGPSSGGTTVTLRGDNLPTTPNASKVWFGTVEGSVISKSSTGWVVTTPSITLDFGSFDVLPVIITCPNADDAVGVNFIFNNY